MLLPWGILTSRLRLSELQVRKHWVLASQSVKLTVCLATINSDILFAEWTTSKHHLADRLRQLLSKLFRQAPNVLLQYIHQLRQRSSEKSEPNDVIKRRASVAFPRLRLTMEGRNRSKNFEFRSGTLRKPPHCGGIRSLFSSSKRPVW